MNRIPCRCDRRERPARARRLALAALTVSWMLVPALSAQEEGPRYRIDSGEGTCLHLRTTPGPNGDSIECVPHGTIVTRFDSDGAWHAIALPDGRTGWSFAGLLAELPSAESEVQETAASESPTLRPVPETEPVSPPESPPPTQLATVETDLDREFLDEFEIGIGDVLLIEVFGLEELDRKVRVLRDGTVSLPLLGNFSIAGLSVAAAEQRIGALLKDRQLVNDPQVSIFVEEFVSLGTIIQGAVEKPGVYPLTGRKTLLELIGQAGGLLGGDSARAGNSLYVLRGDSEEGRERIDIDLERLVDQGDVSLDIPLQPGDIVVIPHVRTEQVFVNGAVVRPGPVEFQSSEGITLLQAVTAAGGPTERANLSNLFILRSLPDGSQERIKANLKKIGRGKEPDVALQKGDIISVGVWPF